jgi:hypothetical protein
MSAIESLLRPKKLVSFDRILFVAVSLFLLSFGALLYVSVHNNLRWLELANILLLLKLNQLFPIDQLPLAVLQNFVLIAIWGCFAAILTVRFIMLRTLKSPALLASAALLAAYPFMGIEPIFYTIDQIRFQANRDFYIAEAKKVEGFPAHAVLDWGSSGMLDSRVFFFLLFDGDSRMASGVEKPSDLVPKDDDKTSCEGSMHWLSGSFYSIAVSCVGI